MRKLVIAILIVGMFLICVNYAESMPFLTCDPANGVTSYILTDNGNLVGQFKAKKDGSFRYDARKFTVGKHRLTLTPCSRYWCGVQAGSLEMTRPKQPSKPIITGGKVEIN